MSKKFVVGGLAAGLALLAAVLYYRNNNTTKPAETPTDQAATQEETKNDITPPTAGQPAPSSEPEKAQPTTPQASPTFTVTLTRAGQVGSSIQIRAIIEGATTGTCTVTFSGPGTTFSKTTNFVFDGRTYSCGALDAATSEFSKAGAWNYSLKATSGTTVSSAITGQVSVSK